MTKINDHSFGCISPTKVVDIAMCYIGITFAQNTLQALIGGELKTTPAIIKVSAGSRCFVNRPRVPLTLGRFANAN